jgi:hypothetical protein
MAGQHAEQRAPLRPAKLQLFLTAPGPHGAEKLDPQRGDILLELRH